MTARWADRMSATPRALVTGATGFIGSHLISALIARGIVPYALCRRTSVLTHLEPWIEGQDFFRVEGDLSDAASLERACAAVKPDYVFHLAGVIAARGREGYFAGNAAGTERLTRAALTPEGRAHLKRLVYVSSLAAGGPSRFSDGRARTEQDPDAPVSAYGESKREGEIRLQRAWLDVLGEDSMRRSEGPSYVIVRPPMVYGPKDSGLFVVIKTVASGIVPILPGEESAQEKHYSIIHVTDLVDSIVRASVAEVRSGEVFYVSGGEHTYTEFLGAIESAVGRRARKVRVPKLILYGLAQASGIWERLSKKPQMLNPDKLHEILPNRWTCSNDKAALMLGFKPRVRLVDGMTETVQWYRKAKWIKD